MGQAFCRTGGMRVRPLVSPSQPPPSRPPNLAASVQVPFPPHTQGQDSPSVGVAVVVVHGCWMSRPHHARDAYGAPPPQEWGLQEEIRDGDAQDGIAARWNLAAFLFRCIASRPCGGGGGGIRGGRRSPATRTGVDEGRRGSWPNTQRQSLRLGKSPASPMR